MAKGRIVNKEISESDSYASLGDSDSQLLCVLLTPWWDDWGKMIGDEEWIKGNIVRKLPQFTIENISRCLKNISDHVDVIWWTNGNGNKYLYWAKFDVHETINPAKRTKDRLPSPKLSQNSPGNIQSNSRNPQEVDGKAPQQEEGKGGGKEEEEGKGGGKEEEEGKNPPPTLILSEREKEVFVIYENYLGEVPVTLVPNLKHAANTYSLDWVQDAFITMSEANIERPCWKYVNSILDRWALEGHDNHKGKHQKGGDPTPEEFRVRYGHMAKSKDAL